MRRAKDISSDYFKADREDRFEYLYDHYGNREGVLRTQKRNFIYLVEGLMMRSSWEGFCKYYDSMNRKATMKKISNCMESGEAFDFTKI